MNIKRLMRIVTMISYIVFFMIIERMLGCAGAGIVALATMTYSVLFTFIMGSMKDTLAKMVSIRRHRGFFDNANRVFGYCIAYTVVAGAVMLAVFALFSRGFGMFMFGDGSIDTVLMILGVFFMIDSVARSIKGYYIGCGGSFVLTIAEAVKCVFLIALSPFLVKFFSGIGNKAANLHKVDFLVDVYGAFGAVLSMCVADLLMLIILLFGLKSAMHNDSFSFNEVRSRDGFKSFLRAFISPAFEKLAENIFPLIIIFSVVCMYCRNCFAHNYSSKQVYENIGTLFIPGLAATVFALLMYREYISMNKKKLRTDYKKDDRKSLVSDFTILLKNAVTIVFPACLSLIIFSGSIPKCIFGCETVEAEKIVLLCGITALFAGLDIAFANALDSIGHESLSLLGRLIGFVSAGILMFAFGKREPQLSSVVIAVMLYYIVCTIVHGTFAIKDIAIRPNDILAKLIKVLIACASLSIVDVVVAKLLHVNLVILIVGIIAGYVAYVVTLVLIKGVSKKDIQGMSGALLYYPLTFAGNIFRVR